jgi:hypothetical protein
MKNVLIVWMVKLYYDFGMSHVIFKVGDIIKDERTVPPRSVGIARNSFHARSTIGAGRHCHQ